MVLLSIQYIIIGLALLSVGCSQYQVDSYHKPSKPKYVQSQPSFYEFLGLRQALVFPKAIILAYGGMAVTYMRLFAYEIAYILLSWCWLYVMLMICSCESNCSLLRTLGHHCDINSNERVVSCHENLLLHGRPTESCNFIMQQHNEFVFNACCNTDLRALVGMMAGVFTFYLCFSGSNPGPWGEIGNLFSSHVGWRIAVVNCYCHVYHSAAFLFNF